MTANVLLRQEVETSPLSGGDRLIGERGGQQGIATESSPGDGEVVPVIELAWPDCLREFCQGCNS